MRTLVANFLLAVALLAGCGQMGPLYMPTEQATPTTGAAAGDPEAGDPAAGDPAGDPVVDDPAADDPSAGDASGASPPGRY